jgi:hypothetical protein
MGFLHRLFTSNSGRRIEHPVLGEALLIHTKSGAYWEVETEVQQRPFTITIEAPDRADPSESQVAFFQKFSRNPDFAFAQAAPLLTGEYEKWVRQPFPANWRDAFELVGMTVPVAGNELNPWDLSFDCLQDRAGHQFTCTFEDGKPSSISIDG